MQNFEYDITILIPIYNAEMFLNDTLESIIAQKGEINYEVLLIDDGSTDKTESICKLFSSKYENFKYHYKQNGGVSETRNYGLDIAKGKYILFLDADDLLLDDTLQHTVKLFNKYENDADILSLPLFSYIHGEKEEHIRTINNNDEGLVNVKYNPYINQCTINVVIKNLPKDQRIYFDTDLKQSEDALFNTKQIFRRGTIIMSSHGGYLYRKDHSSTVNLYANPATIKDMLLKFLERMLDIQNSDIYNLYAQSMVLYEIGWRLKMGILFPQHLSGIKKVEWYERFKKIINRIDNESLMNNPYLDKYHATYLITTFKNNISYEIDAKGIYFSQDGEMFTKSNNYHMVFSQIRCLNNKLIIKGFIKGQLFSLIQEDKILIIKNKSSNTVKKVKLNYISAESMYRTTYKVTEFYDFNEELELGAKYEFWMQVGNEVYKLSHYFRNFVIFNKQKRYNTALYGNYIITFNKSENADTFSINSEMNKTLKKTHKEKEKRMLNLKRNKNLKKYINTFEYTKFYYSRKKIWIYNDIINVFDNGYEQFIHDYKKKDGIDRYYVVDKETLDNRLLEKIPKSKLIIRNSLKHKVLFMHASLILSSYAGFADYSPIPRKLINGIYNRLKYKFVYLQHGVLHAHIPRIYSNHATLADYVVVSSEIEKSNLISMYGFTENQIIMSGMPRLDRPINIDKKRKILFAPSWRISLTEGMENGKWNINNNIVKSKFYQGINNFLNDKELQRLLEKYNYTLDIKLHPNFTSVVSNFNIKSDKMNFITKNTKFNIGEYNILITDFSSFMFDFFRTKSKIIQFIPDYDLFVNGNHTYRSFDIDLSILGKVNISENDLIEQLESTLKDNAKLTEEQNEFYDNFFVRNNSKDFLYKKLIKIK